MSAKATLEIRNAPVPFFIKPITRGIASRVDSMYLTQNLNTHFSFLEEQLKTSPNSGKYLCGSDLTAADILMSFPLEAASQGKIDAKAYPKLMEYIDMISKNEVNVRSVKKAEELGVGNVKPKL